MQNIAVTGSFASGKSFILNCLSSMGYKTFSCDDYVKKLYQDLAIQKLVENSIESLGAFNKQRLAHIICNDKKSRQKLEKIIHPKVRLAIKEFENINKNEKIIFTEVPLLFESGFNEYFSYNICAFCSEETRFLRAQERGLVDPIIFEKIKNIQLPQEDKKKRADFVINTEQEKEKIDKDLMKIIKGIT